MTRLTQKVNREAQPNPEVVRLTSPEMQATMKHCPDCHAPNPTRLTRCYACGVLLDAPPKAALKPGERTFPCLNCDGAVPYSAGECPHCGKLFDAGATKAPRLSVSPPGWELQPLPDGTARLHRRGWVRAVRDFSQWGAVAVIAYYIVSALAVPLAASSRSGGSSANYWQPWVFLSPFAVLALLWLAWVIAGREEIRIGRDWLEHRIGLGKWQRVKRITTGVLTIRSDWYGGRSPSYQHRLTVTGRGGSVTLDSRTPNEYGATLFSTPDPYVPSELSILAEVAASYTGWNFVKPIRF